MSVIGQTSTKIYEGPGILFREGIDLFVKGSLKSSMQQFRQILHRSRRKGDRNNIGWSLLHLAMVLRRKRLYSEVIRFLDEARSEFQSIENQFGLASVLRELSVAQREMDRNTIALEVAHQSARLFEQLGLKLEMAWAYDNLAAIHFKLFNQQEARNYAEKARTIFTECNSELGLAWNSCHLASLYMDTGQYNLSEEHYNQAYQRFSKKRVKEGMASCLLGLGTVYRAQYRFEEALRSLSRAEELFLEIGHKDKAGWSLLNTAAIKRISGKYKESLHLNYKGLKLLSPLRNNAGVAWGLFQIGQIQRDRGQYVKSWQTLREALNLHIDVAHKKGVGWTSSEWGKTYLALSDYSHAKECFLKANAIAGDLGDGPLQADAQKNLAKLNMEEGLLQKASSGLEKAMAIGSKFESRESEAHVRCEQIRMAIMIGDVSRGESLLDELSVLIQRFDLVHLKPRVQVLKAELLCARGKTDEAVELLKAAFDEAGRIGLRHVRAQALMGLIQLRLINPRGLVIDRYLKELEKEVRLLNSRKIRAKYLYLKGLVIWKRSGTVESRLFNQCLNTLSSSKIMVVQRQILMSLMVLYRSADRLMEYEDMESQNKSLLRHGPVDLHLIQPRFDLFPDLPVSLVV